MKVYELIEKLQRMPEWEEVVVAAETEPQTCPECESLLGELKDLQVELMSDAQAKEKLIELQSKAEDAWMELPNGESESAEGIADAVAQVGGRPEVEIKFV